MQQFSTFSSIGGGLNCLECSLMCCCQGDATAGSCQRAVISSSIKQLQIFFFILVAKTHIGEMFVDISKLPVLTLVSWWIFPLWETSSICFSIFVSCHIFSTLYDLVLPVTFWAHIKYFYLLGFDTGTFSSIWPHFCYILLENFSCYNEQFPFVMLYRIFNIVSILIPCLFALVETDTLTQCGQWTLWRCVCFVWTL